MNRPISASYDRADFAPDRSRDINLYAVAVGAGLVVLGSAYIGAAVSVRQTLLFLLGSIAGLILYHAAFGFTFAWRVFISDQRGAGLRAQMLMLAVASVLFVPALASGTVLGEPVRGSVSPLGLAVIVGAFLFGAGMQLGGG